MDYIWRRSVRAGRLRTLRPVLNKWRELMEDEEWLEGDAPWWYNERASLSILAGALWSTDGWAFEEFHHFKRQNGQRHGRRLGRTDLLFHHKDHAFMAEAKQCWPILTSTPESALTKVTMHLKSASDDVRKCSPYGYRRMAIVCISPRVPVSHRAQTDPRVRRFVEAFQQRFDGAALAWTFPERQRHPETDGYAHPGAAVLLKPLRYS